MAKVVGVRFRNAGKLYYFDPGPFWPIAGSYVIVETARGLEYGQVIVGVAEVSDELLGNEPLKSVQRIANDEDTRHQADNEKFNIKAHAICQEKIDEHKLEMKLVGVEQTFDNTKLLFYFTANGRVDFRALVKDLAGIFHTRIELRQIGVRDEAKMLGGLGPCGRPICCGSFLGDFQPVSIKMAKEQNLSLNPTKISGVCGRLMCCLKFEEDHYEAAHKRMPKIGRDIETPDGHGTVFDINVLKETVSVRIFKGDNTEIKEYPLEDLNWRSPALAISSETTEKTKASTHEKTKSNNKTVKDDENASCTVSAEESIITSNEEVTASKSEANDWLKAVEEALNAAEGRKQ